MEKLVTLRVLVKKSQKAWIKEKAKEKKVYEAAIVREVLDNAIRDAY